MEKKAVEQGVMVAENLDDNKKNLGYVDFTNGCLQKFDVSSKVNAKVPSNAISTTPTNPRNIPHVGKNQAKSELSECRSTVAVGSAFNQKFLQTKIPSLTKRASKFGFHILRDTPEDIANKNLVFRKSEPSLCHSKLSITDQPKDYQQTIKYQSGDETECFENAAVGKLVSFYEHLLNSKNNSSFEASPGSKSPLEAKNIHELQSKSKIPVFSTNFKAARRVFAQKTGSKRSNTVHGFVPGKSEKYNSQPEPASKVISGLGDGTSTEFYGATDPVSDELPPSNETNTVETAENVLAITTSFEIPSDVNEYLEEQTEIANMEFCNDSEDVDVSDESDTKKIVDSAKENCMGSDEKTSECCVSVKTAFRVQSCVMYVVIMMLTVVLFVVLFFCEIDLNDIPIDIFASKNNATDLLSWLLSV